MAHEPTIESPSTGLTYSDVRKIAHEEAEKIAKSIEKKVIKNSAKIAHEVIREKASDAVIKNIKYELEKLKSETRKRALFYIGAFMLLLGGFVWLINATVPNYLDKLRDTVYPGRKIYSKITNIVKDDKALSKSIIDSSKDYVRLNSFPNLKADIPESFSDWEVNDFKKLVGNVNFRTAFYEKHSDIVNSILSQASKDLRSREPDLLVEGRIRQPVQILSAGELDGRQTKNCQMVFRNNELQAILILPSGVFEKQYNQYGCTTHKGLYWPTIDIQIESLGKKINNVRIVEVQRSGGADKLQLRVSKLVGERLELPGNKTQRVNNSGYFVVHRVGNLDWDSWEEYNLNQQTDNKSIQPTAKAAAD